ncbi:IS5 family transposase [Bythopirellula goksoeyrii]|uniref:Transposase DDE domain protein n=1 Tax=Bythopirellula goksoeyrii TaxID=1400387 RepID=A0A5B9QHQ7_9BACT|nr:IS5 family transposase [Bythopirellula goksoeyrii]QEG33751.1 Transposase DDE domain protein [Bythopirellula goksoeyrii]
MAKPLVPDELWERIEPLIPKQPSKPKGGRPPIEDRKALTGILFILKTGIAWEDLPQEMQCGSGMTCWRRLRDWQEAGVWEALVQLLLDELREANQIDWSRAAVDSAKARAMGGGEKTGPDPTNRTKPGSKHHVVTDANGIPLNVTLTGANRHDVTQLLPVIDGIPPVTGKPGHPRQRPDQVYADRAYDSQPHRKQLRERGIEPHLAKRNTDHGSGLGIYRWVSERTLSWLHQFRRLKTRYDRREDIHEAFIKIAQALICFRSLNW